MPRRVAIHGERGRWVAEVEGRWLAVLHQTMADARADGDVEKEGVSLARAEQRLTQRRRPHVGLDHAGREARQRRLQRQAHQRNRRRAGDVPIQVDQFGNADADAADGSVSGHRFGLQFPGHRLHVG